MRIKVKKVLGSQEWRDKVDEMDDKELRHTYRLLFDEPPVVPTHTKLGPHMVRMEQMKWNLEAIS